MAANSHWVREEEEVYHAHKIDNRRRRAHRMAWASSQRRKNVFNRQLGWPRNARIMTPEGVQLMRIRSREQRFAKLRGHFHGPAIQIKKSFVKMTELDRVETIDLIQKAFTD